MSEEKKKMYIIIGKHPNSIGPQWVEKIGNKKQIKEYLKQEDLDYIHAVFEMEDGGDDVTEDFLIQNKETFEFSGVKT